MMERACELELMARTMNSPIVTIDDYVIAKPPTDEADQERHHLWADGMAGPGADSGARRRDFRR